MILKLFLLGLLACVSSTFSAKDFVATNADGIVFSCSSLYDGGCSINGLEGMMRYLDEGTTLNIPDTLSDGKDQFEVKEIGENAFSYQYGLVAVNLPNTISNVHDIAFANCENLASVNLGEGIIYIGGSAFSGCNIKEISIPESVLFISIEAFSCTTLEKVEFASLKSFFDITFSGALVNPLESSYRLYIAGEEVTDLTIPESVTELKSYVLTGCHGLKSVHLPASLQSIGKSAFEDCENLKDVYFDDMKSLCSIKYDEQSHLLSNAEHLYIDGNESNALEVADDISTISDYAFANFKGLTSVKLSENVMNIGKGAFKNCSNLKSLSMSAGIKQIGKSTFEGCSSLSSLLLPEGVEEIGERAFLGCSNLYSLTLPQSVEHIGEYAFAGCKLRSIQILAPVPPAISSSSFSAQSTYHTTLYVPQGHFDDYAYDDTYWYRFINIKEFVGESAALGSNSVYSIKDNDAGSFLVYDAVNDCLGRIDLDTNIDNNALSHNWQVVRHDNNASIYNLEAKRYLTQQSDGSWGLLDEEQLVSLTDSSHGCITLDGKGEWMFVVNSSLAAPNPETIITVRADDGSSSHSAYDLIGHVRNADSRNEILIKNGRKMIVR